MTSRRYPMPTMKKHPLVYFFAFAAFAASPLALAGAGQTSAGVTTTTGAIDPTAATQNVQSQSSNFVQENQAAQQSGAVSSLAGTSKTGVAGTSQAGDAANGTGKPGDPNNPGGGTKGDTAAVSAPAAPPAPPPDYVSNIKKVSRDGSTTDLAVVDPAPTAAAKPAATSAAPSAPATNAVGAPGVQRQATGTGPRVAHAAEVAKVSATERTPQPAAPAGGSGSAPDSVAFYIGILIAGALLAFAAATFFRSDKAK